MNQQAEPHGWLELRGRTLLRLTGPDRMRYLNGQVSIDITRLNGDRVRPGCILNVKGKLVALAWFHCEPEALRIDTDTELRETVQARLQRYMVADDVELTDVSDRLALFHWLGSLPPFDPPVQGCWLAADRLGEPGFDLCVPVDRAEQIRNQLARAAPELTPDSLERLRVERGIPRWGAELSPETLPPEAGLDAYAVDYDKGCYLGQEIVSRLRSVGHVNRALRHLVALERSAPLVPGQNLMAPNGTVAGVVTSAVFSFALDTWLGLGYVRKPFWQPGTFLTTPASDAGGGVTFEVRLPIPGSSLR